MMHPPVKSCSMQEVSAPQELDQLLPNLHATLAKASHTSVGGAGAGHSEHTVGSHDSCKCVLVSPRMTGTCMNLRRPRWLMATTHTAAMLAVASSSEVFESLLAR